MMACEILDKNGKAHFTGINSIAEHAAKTQSYRTQHVQLSGHCIPITANEFIHWSSPGLLRDGPVHVNGALPDKSRVATASEHAQFMEHLLSAHR